MTEEEFLKAYRKYMDEGGHSYDLWDLAYAYDDYCQNPGNYEFLTTNK